MSHIQNTDRRLCPKARPV